MIFLDDLDSHDHIIRRDLSREELLSYVESFPALLWRIEIARSRIEFLNRYTMAGLNEKTSLFMKSAEIRRKIVLDEDMYFLESFMEAMKRGENAETIVRIKGPGADVLWLKLVGWMHPKDLRYYMGYLMDVSNRAEAIKSIIEREAELQLMIELSEIPVMLVDLDSKNVISQNAAAAHLFLYTPDEFRALKFSDLYHRGMTNMIHKLYEEIIFSKKWEGKALFERKTNSVFAAEASVRFLLLKDKRILRIALSNIETASVADLSQQETPLEESRKAQLVSTEQEFMRRLDGQRDMDAILKTLLDCQLPNYPFDAILFSDILAKKNRVFVYSAGEPFASMSQGEMYSYEGTIAQDIERFKLDYLIVDDTLESIKAIDWALFIPKGIRSYFAKPFYQRGILRAVMILCSLRPNAFRNDGMVEYSILFEPFRMAIQSWRAGLQHKPGSK